MRLIFVVVLSLLLNPVLGYANKQLETSDFGSGNQPVTSNFNLPQNNQPTNQASNAGLGSNFWMNNGGISSSLPTEGLDPVETQPEIVIPNPVAQQVTEDEVEPPVDLIALTEAELERKGIPIVDAALDENTAALLTEQLSTFQTEYAQLNQQLSSLQLSSAEDADLALMDYQVRVGELAERLRVLLLTMNTLREVINA